MNFMNYSIDKIKLFVFFFVDRNCSFSRTLFIENKFNLNKFKAKEMTIHNFFLFKIK
jgi:hypothetical protein